MPSAQASHPAKNLRAGQCYKHREAGVSCTLTQCHSIVCEASLQQNKLYMYGAGTPSSWQAFWGHHHGHTAIPPEPAMSLTPIRDAPFSQLFCSCKPDYLYYVYLTILFIGLHCMLTTLRNTADYAYLKLCIHEPRYSNEAPASEHCRSRDAYLSEA